MISVTGDAVLLEFGTGSGLSSSSSATDASALSSAAAVGGGVYTGDLGFSSVSGSTRMSSAGLDYMEGSSQQQNTF